MDVGSILEMFAFYEASPTSRRQQWEEAATPATLKAGSFYFRTGSECTAVAFVGSGRVRVFKPSEDGREISLYHVGAGETCLLTLVSALTGDRYAADGVADEEVDAAMVPVSVFRTWFETDRVFRDFVLRTIGGRMVALMQLVEEVAFQRVDRRLAQYLLQSSNRLEVISVTHQEVAAYLGSSRETVSRSLKELERRGLLELSRGLIRIQDRSGLHAYATSL